LLGAAGPADAPVPREVVGRCRAPAAAAGLDGAVLQGTLHIDLLRGAAAVRRQPGHLFAGEVEHELVDDGLDGGLQLGA
jgi:hypothetical protein